jgi:outer membrane protein
VTLRSAYTILAIAAALAVTTAVWAQTPPSTNAPTASQPSSGMPVAPPPATPLTTPTPPNPVPVVGGPPSAPAASTTPPPNPLAVIGAPPPPPPAPTGPIMALDDVIAQVLNQNPTVVQARLAAQHAHAVIGEATGQGLPQIRVGANDTYSSVASNGVSEAETPTISPVTSIPVITDSASGSLSPGVSQPLSSTIAATSSGSGSTTTSTTAPTITPVGAPTETGSGSSSGATSSSSSPSSSSSTTGAATGDDVPNARPEQAGGGTSPSVTSPTESLHHNNYDAEGTVSQIIDLFGLVHANVSAAKESAQFYDLDLNRVEDDEALDVKDVYFAVIKAVSDVASAQEQLTNANATLAVAQVNYKAGASPEFDVISAQAEVASAQASLINAQNELDIENANVNNLLTRPIESPVNVTPVAEVTVPGDTPSDRLIMAADQDRPEVQETVISQEIAGNLTHLAREGLTPSLGVTGAAIYQPNTSSLAGSSSASDYTESLTASLSVPLWDGGVTAASVKAAQIDEATQRSVRDEILNDVALEVKSALVNVIDAQSLETADQAAVTSDREALRIAGISYTSGAGTLLAVTNAEANLAIAEDNLNSAVYQQQTAYAALSRAEGKR